MDFFSPKFAESLRFWQSPNPQRRERQTHNTLDIWQTAPSQGDNPKEKSVVSLEWKPPKKGRINIPSWPSFLSTNGVKKPRLVNIFFMFVTLVFSDNPQEIGSAEEKGDKPSSSK